MIDALVTDTVDFERKRNLTSFKLRVLKYDGIDIRDQWLRIQVERVSSFVSFHEDDPT